MPPGSSRRPVVWPLVVLAAAATAAGYSLLRLDRASASPTIDAEKSSAPTDRRAPNIAPPTSEAIRSEDLPDVGSDTGGAEARLPADEPLLPAAGEVEVVGRVSAQDAAPVAEEWRIEAWRGASEETLEPVAVGELRSFRQEGREFSFVADRSAPLLLLRARTRASASAPRRIEPARIESRQEVELILRASARVHGRVVPARESRLEKLPVLLMPRNDVADPVARAAGSTVLIAWCDAEGAFSFDAVAVGPHRLSVGSRSAPLAVVAELDVRGPETEIPPLQVPALFDKPMRILDEHGNAVAGARVTGNAGAGGRIDFTTDLSGRGSARFVAAGRCRLFAWDSRHRRGNAFVDLADDGSEPEIRITFREMGTGKPGTR